MEAEDPPTRHGRSDTTKYSGGSQLSQLDLRPVTPEVAGSSPVGPAKVKDSCAATSRRLCFVAAPTRERPAQDSATQVMRRGRSTSTLRTTPGSRRAASPV